MCTIIVILHTGKHANRSKIMYKMVELGFKLRWVDSQACRVHRNITLAPQAAEKSLSPRERAGSRGASQGAQALASGQSVGTLAAAGGKSHQRCQQDDGSRVTLSPCAPWNSMKESESEVAQSCPTLCDPTDCSLPGSEEPLSPWSFPGKSTGVGSHLV